MSSNRVVACSVSAVYCLLSAVLLMSSTSVHAQTTRVPTFLKPEPGASPSSTKPKTINLSKIVVAPNKSPKYCFLPTTRSSCMATGDRNTNINNFFETDKSLSFLGQIKSIYNGASSATTASADIGSLNFAEGWQLTIGTNIQAGSTAPITVNSGTVPTLSAASAGQAAQNMLYGGTITASGLLPLFVYGSDQAKANGGLAATVNLIGREGFDIQNFKGGTSTTVNSPSSHSSLQAEGYLLLNSINLSPDKSTYAGSIFVGGNYGYSYTSHGYARNYGFGNNVNNGIGMVSAGVVISGVAKIAISRGFGPSQTYIDSTSNVQTTGNKFKAWSFGISYQAPAAKTP